MYLLEYHHPYKNIWDRDNNSLQQSADTDNLTSKSINGKLRALWLAKMIRKYYIKGNMPWKCHSLIKYKYYYIKTIQIKSTKINKMFLI